MSVIGKSRSGARQTDRDRSNRKPLTGPWGCWIESDWKADYISYRDETPVFKDNKELFLPPA